MKNNLKIKTNEEIRKLSDSDLVSELKEANKQLFVLKKKKQLGELKQTHLIAGFRKYIAILNTIAREKTLNN